MKVDFQIIHSFKPKELKERLLSLLKETVNESTTSSIRIEEKPKKIEDWSIFNWLEMKYNHSSGNKYIAGFSLVIEFNVEESDTNVEESKKLTEEFGQKLQANNVIIIKYNDEGMQIEHQEYAKEIFELEMELREAISFIFLDTYKGDYYNLLKDVDVNIEPIEKNIKPKEDYFKSHFENELFFLNFSGYIKLNELKTLKESDLIGMILVSDNYDNLKQKIQNRGVSKEEYKGFLDDVSKIVNPIEKLRNCIAHNRSIPNEDELIINYEKAKERLENSISEFWEHVKNDQTEGR